MNQKQIKELLKAHSTIENGRWVFKKVDIDAASLELEQAFCQTPVMRGQSPEPATQPSYCSCGAEIPADDPYDGYCTDCG